MGLEGLSGGEQPMEDPILLGFQEIAKEILDKDPTLVTPDARFKEDLDADSLDMVEVVMGIEEKYEITLPDEELEGVSTVAQAMDLVRSKLPPAE